MVDREVGNHPFQIGLGPCGQGSENDRADGETEKPRSKRLHFPREKRKQETNESVNAHFRKDPGEDHRDAGRRRFVGVRQPGVKRKKRHLYGEPEKDAPEGEPAELAGEQRRSPRELGEARKIEGPFREINSKKGEEHRDAAEESVEEKLSRSPIAVRAAPDFDEEETGDEAHLVKEEPENEIVSREIPVERRLHQEEKG